MVLVGLLSDALSQDLTSYSGSSYLGRGVSLYSCSREVQLLLLTLDEGYLLMATPPDLERGVAPLGPLSLEVGLLLLAATPDLGHGEVGLRMHTTNKASGGDGIPVEVFQILNNDAVKVLHSICQQIWKTQQWPQDWKRPVFIPIPKNAQTTTHLHSSHSLVK